VEGTLDSQTNRCSLNENILQFVWNFSLILDVIRIPPLTSHSALQCQKIAKSAQLNNNKLMKERGLATFTLL
jgi:5-formaminoimidazole-4-carboxamide-1-beta-D-ribofuranosyl 5'-monophosphate synthetase